MFICPKCKEKVVCEKDARSYEVIENQQVQEEGDMIFIRYAGHCYNTNCEKTLLTFFVPEEQ